MGETLLCKRRRGGPSIADSSRQNTRFPSLAEGSPSRANELTGICLLGEESEVKYACAGARKQARATALRKRIVKVKTGRLPPASAPEGSVGNIPRGLFVL